MMRLLLLLLIYTSFARAEDATFLNLVPEKAPAIAAAARDSGLQTVAMKNEDDLRGKVVIYQTGSAVSDAQAEAIGAFVQNGGGLLVTLSQKPGWAPLRLAFMLPTTLWHAADNVRGPLTLQESDAAFFKGANLQGFSVPWHAEIRPWHAAERGQARYDRYERPAPWMAYKNPADSEKYPHLAPDSFFWSRPLLNRNWQIAARGDDIFAAPLLLTGTYGAGRVAVFASSGDVADSPAARAFFKATFEWLRAAPPAQKAPEIKPQIQIKPQAENRVLQLQINNPGAALNCKIMARLATWERAPLGDLERNTTLQTGDNKIEFPLPPPLYQAQQWRDAFFVRAGVLSADGAHLLNETHGLADARPTLVISVASPEERTREYPFHAALPEKYVRLGVPIYAYAFAPGQTVSTTVTLENGLRNLAPLAKVTNETNTNDKTLIALNDEAALGEKGADWYAPTASGMWIGKAGKDQILRFDLPQSATLSRVVLVGTPDTYRNFHRRNPAIAKVEVDGQIVAEANDLEARFLAENGRVVLNFVPRQGQSVRVTIGDEKQDVWLGEIEIGGAFERPKPITGLVTLTRRDSLSGDSKIIGEQWVTVGAALSSQLRFAVALPDDKAAHFYRLEATFKGDSTQSAALPVMALSPQNPLQPNSDFEPPDAAQMGFIVTRGFRNVFDNAIGTDEIGPGWGQPDDLAWAYAHGFKQLSQNSKTQANRLWLSESDTRHYSTPWRQFFNGEEFYDVAAPLLVERMKQSPNWKKSDVVVLGQSDRWDSGPEVGALHAWQDFEGFNEWLKAHGKPLLQGKTRQELMKEIHGGREGEWNAWHLERYLKNLRTLREAFAKEGKKLVIKAQGVPLVPGRAGDEVGQVVKGGSDDSTWGMTDNDIPFVTARQMAALAINPYLQMSTLNQWGYDSQALGNREWRGPVSTTEPSRRHQFDRAFRGTIRPDGSYSSMHTFGYNTNAGIAFTMNENDYNQWQREQEKHSLLTPEAPLGVGLIISTAALEKPENTRFTAGTAESFEEGKTIMQATRVLQEAGVSIAFAANALCLEKWSGNAPLIILNLPQFSSGEIKTLETLAARGVKIAVFLPDENITAPLLQNPNVMRFAINSARITRADAERVAPQLLEKLNVPLRFAPGTSGYGFVSNGRKFVLVEDWREVARTATIRVQSNAQNLRAVETNEHTPLVTRRVGAWWEIDVPLLPGDGALLAIAE